VQIPTHAKGSVSAFERRLPIWCLAAILAFVVPGAAATAQDKAMDEQICNPTADYFLGIEDYHETIRLHRKILDSNPNNALARYHLGFAYGMVGRRTAEKHEYLRAVGLGLKQWDLFLNLGLAYLEGGEVKPAVDALRTAATIAPGRPEVHFNLGLGYERSGMLVAALHEILASLRLDPNQADARNALAVVYAELGDYECAQKEWAHLVRAVPDYAPAQVNLSILQGAYGLRGSPPSGGTVRKCPEDGIRSDSITRGNQCTVARCSLSDQWVFSPHRSRVSHPGLEPR